MHISSTTSHLTVGSSGDGVGEGVTGFLVGDNVVGSSLGLLVTG